MVLDRKNRSGNWIIRAKKTISNEIVRSRSEIYCRSSVYKKQVHFYAYPVVPWQQQKVPPRYCLKISKKKSRRKNLEGENLERQNSEKLNTRKIHISKKWIFESKNLERTSSRKQKSRKNEFSKEKISKKEFYFKKL